MVADPADGERARQGDSGGRQPVRAQEREGGGQQPQLAGALGHPGEGL